MNNNPQYDEWIAQGPFCVYEFAKGASEGGGSAWAVGHKDSDDLRIDYSEEWKVREICRQLNMLWDYNR